MDVRMETGTDSAYLRANHGRYRVHKHLCRRPCGADHVQRFQEPTVPVASDHQRAVR